MKYVKKIFTCNWDFIILFIFLSKVHNTFLSGEPIELDGDPIIYEDGIHFVEESFGAYSLCRAYNKIHCDISHHDESIFVDVVWFVDGEYTPIETMQGSGTFSYSDLPALLTTEDLINSGYRAGITVC